MRVEANVIKGDMHGVEIFCKGNEVYHRNVRGSRRVYKTTEIIPENIAKEHVQA